eukprot:5917378-Prymnesium_polylepis.1
MVQQERRAHTFVIKWKVCASSDAPMRSAASLITSTDRRAARASTARGAYQQAAGRPECAARA